MRALAFTMRKRMEALARGPGSAAATAAGIQWAHHFEFFAELGPGYLIDDISELELKLRTAAFDHGVSMAADHVELTRIKQAFAMTHRPRVFAAPQQPRSTRQPSNSESPFRARMPVVVRCSWH